MTKADLTRAFSEALIYNEKHGGGSRVIHFGDSEVVAPFDDIKEAVDILLKSQNRHKTLANIRAYLAKHLPAVKKGKASQTVAMNCCQDITIWFANEIIEGRATLEMN